MFSIKSNEVKKLFFFIIVLRLVAEKFAQLFSPYEIIFCENSFLEISTLHFYRQYTKKVTQKKEYFSHIV